MTWHLRNQGHGVNEKRIRRLMRLMRLMGLMGLMPIYQKPNTSRPAKEAQDLPLPALGPASGSAQPGQVAPTSPTSPCDALAIVLGPRADNGSLLYLVAVMDWATRTVLAWRLSNTLEADCLASRP